MRRALFSIMLIGIVAVGATLGGLAAFSDTEESKGNTFTAGDLDLKIDWEQYWNGELIDNQPMTDLDDMPIFTLDDIKPGDTGEATISLHVYTNDAWVCGEIIAYSNDDMSTNEPESLVDDNENESCVCDGELSQNMNLMIWLENDGSNTYEEITDKLLFSGKASELANPFEFNMDQNLNCDDGIQPLIGCENYYIAMSWNVPPSVGNEIQSDQIMFDINFYAYQYRHQEDNNPCITIEEWPDGGITTVAFEDLQIGAGNDYDYNDWVIDIETEAVFLGESVEDRNLTNMNFYINPEARGAGYNHVFHMLFPADTFACDGNYSLVIYDNEGNVEDNQEDTFDASVTNDFIVIPDTRTALPGTITNADESEPYVTPKRIVELKIDFGDGCEFDFSEYDPYSTFHGDGLFFDPYLHVNNTGEDIHWGDVRMLTVPSDWMWPEEGEAIWDVYDDVTENADGMPEFVSNWWENYNNLVYDIPTP